MPRFPFMDFGGGNVTRECLIQLCECSNRLFPLPLPGLGRSNKHVFVVGTHDARILPDIRLFQKRLATLVHGDGLEMTEGIANEIDRGAFRESILAPSSESMTATARKARKASRPVGRPPPASSRRQVLRRLLWARRFSRCAPASVAAFLIFLMAAPSEPSAIRMPIARP